jgi:alpha-tubulin suppressor-like RCC1 family protein
MLIEQLMLGDTGTPPGNLLYAWGNNATGQLGFGGASSLGSPVQVGNSSWSMSSTGAHHTAGITADGLLFTWGWNAQGQIGDGTTTNRNSPVQIGSSSWSMVSAGHWHTTAIRSDGLLFTWGYNSIGEIGDGTRTRRDSPVQIGSSSWTVVAAGGHRYGNAITLAIRSDGLLFGWGDGSLTGQGSSTHRSSPVQIGSSSWTTVFAGLGRLNNHVAAIRNDGLLFTWGFNNLGQLGDGTTTNRNSPVQIGSSSWTAITCGYLHTGAIRSDGLLFTWGRGGNGELGDGAFSNRNSPVQIGSSSWTAISQGFQTTDAVRSDGRLFAWGNNTGSPVQVGSSSWTVIRSGAGTRVDTSAYAAQTQRSAILSNGLLFAWGDSNLTGKLGLGDNFVDKSVPAQLGTQSWKMIAASRATDFVFYTVAIRSDDLLFTWGNNDSGQLGDGTTTSRFSPVQIGTSSWTMVSVGGRFGATAAIRSDGGLFTWGSNFYSVIPNGGNSPVQVGSSSWTMVGLSRYNGAAIRSDGLLFGWGRGNINGIGTGTGSPVQMGSDSWTMVVGGGLHTAAIRNDGLLFTWGFNGSGQLGDGTTTNRNSPVQIGSSSWTTISLGTGRFQPDHSVAIRSDGLLFTWGSNGGALGDGTTTNKSSPVQIGSSSWTAATAGFVHTAAIRSDGLLFAWGNNGSGQLGLNTRTDTTSPVQVGSSSWTAVTAGQQSTFGLLKEYRFGWGWGGIN